MKDLVRQKAKKNTNKKKKQMRMIDSDVPVLRDKIRKRINNKTGAKEWENE